MTGLPDGHDDTSRPVPGAPHAPIERSSALRTVFRRVVLGVFACIAAVILLLVGMAVFSAAGLSADPHGYGMIFGILLAVLLAPIALALWLLYRSLRPRGERTSSPS